MSAKLAAALFSDAGKCLEYGAKLDGSVDFRQRLLPFS
jgi:hypothetical protein